MKNKEILDTWKEISQYLGKEIRTCSRWEKELGLPVHRIDESSSKSKVFAYKSDIDRWLEERSLSKRLKKQIFLKNKWAVVGLIFGFFLLSATIIFLSNSSLFSPSPKILSIAVIPFENSSSSKHEDFFSEGITNELIHNITKLSKLKVIPASSLDSSSKILKAPSEIGKELNADYILMGKIEKDEKNFRIFVQLIGTKNEKKIWDSEYDGKLEDIFYIQENICKKIGEQLNIGAEAKAPLLTSDGKTHDYTAFESYLKGKYILKRLKENSKDPWTLYHQGRYYWGEYTTESNEFAIDFFNQAISIDPNFAQAYLGLAQCYINFVNLNWNVDIKWIEKAKALVEKAQTLDPYLPEYYRVLIQIYLIEEIGFNKNTKDLAFELASEGIIKYPNHPLLNSIVGYCYYQKYGEEGNETDFAKALEYKEKSFWLIPYALDNIVYSELLMLNEDFDEAIRICNIIDKRDSSMMARFQKGEIYYNKGDLYSSEGIFQQFDMPLEYEIGALYYLGMISAQRGEAEKARRILQEIHTQSPEFHGSDLKLASIYMGIGEKEEGYQYLESFFDTPRVKKMKYKYHRFIGMDRNFFQVREEEKFQKIINK